MKSLLFIVTLFAGTVLAEDLPKTLVTTNGYTYTAVSVVEATSDTLTITHAKGSSKIPSKYLPKEWREHFKMEVPLSKYRLDETLEQCRTRYGQEGKSFDGSWVKFEKDGFIILCHFTAGIVDEIQYRRPGERRNENTPLSPNEITELLHKAAADWIQKEDSGESLAVWRGAYGIAEYHADHVLMVYTEERSKQADAERIEREKVEKWLAKERLKGL